MKPMQPPTSATRMMDTVGEETKRETISIVIELMQLTPTASPSSPSIRFTALVQPTIQRIVSGMESQPIWMNRSWEKTLGLEMVSKTMPLRMAAKAAKNCPSSLTQGLRETISSTAPMAAIIPAPSSRPSTWESRSTKSSTDSTKPRKIARPPIRGMG